LDELQSFLGEEGFTAIDILEYFLLELASRSLNRIFIL
jgi:hypothetical protein